MPFLKHFSNWVGMDILSHRNLTKYSATLKAINRCVNTNRSCRQQLMFRQGLAHPQRPQRQIDVAGGEHHERNYSHGFRPFYLSLRLNYHLSLGLQGCDLLSSKNWLFPAALHTICRTSNEKRTRLLIQT